MKSIKELLGLSEEAKAKKMKGDDPCWDSHEMVGMKKGKGGKPVPNCVPKNEEVESVTEMENRSKENDDHERREYGPEGTKKREKKTQELLKRVSPSLRKKLRLPDPKEDVAEGIVDDMPADSMVGTMDKIRGDAKSQRYHYLQKLLKQSKNPKTITKIKALLTKEFPQGVAEDVEIAEAKVGDTVSFHHELQSAPGTKVKKSGTVEKVEGGVVHVKVKDKYGVKRHQVKMGDLVKEDTELEEQHSVLFKMKKNDPKIAVAHYKSKEDAHKFLQSVKDKGGNGIIRSKTNEDTEQIDELNKDTELEEASDTKRPPNFTMYPIDRQDYKILRKPKKALPKSGKEWGRDAGEKKIKEEVDQIDELNKDTVYSYNKKADADIDKKHKSLGQLMRKGDAAGANKASHQINRRLAGMERAEKRLNSEEVEIDEAEAVKKVKMTPQERSYKRKLGLKAVVQEAVKKMREKKGDPSQSKDVKKGEQLSGKQEPVKVNPELQVK